MSEEVNATPGSKGDKRLFQMSAEHIEYRLKVLEDERLPHRMQAAELVIGQLQGEVTAIKEIARGIGVKLDSGVEKIATESNARMAHFEMGRAQDKAFLKGVLWILGALGAVLLVVKPLLAEVFKRILSQ